MNRRNLISQLRQDSIQSKFVIAGRETAKIAAKKKFEGRSLSVIKNSESTSIGAKPGFLQQIRTLIKNIWVWGKETLGKVKVSLDFKNPLRSKNADSQNKSISKVFKRVWPKSSMQKSENNIMKGIGIARPGDPVIENSRGSSSRKLASPSEHSGVSATSGANPGSIDSRKEAPAGAKPMSGAGVQMAQNQAGTIYKQYQESVSKVPVDEYGVKTYEMDVSGINRKVVVKEFEEDSYNGPITEDFKDRGQHIIDSLKNHMKSEGKLDEQTEANLNNLAEQYKKDIDSEARIDPKEMNKGENVDHYKEKQSKAETLVRQLVKDARFIGQQVLGSEFSTKELDKIEREYVMNQGRPIIMCVYKVEGGKTRVSMQVPGSEEDRVIPSSVRYEKGLANFAVHSFGSIDENGNISISQSVIRHSTYSTINKEDGFERQGDAVDNVRQELDFLVKQQIEERRESGESLEGIAKEGITISHSVMMLLTPMQGDWARNRSKGVGGKWKGESEGMQLKESARALQTYDGSEITVKMGETEIKVKIDINTMNFGTNAGATDEGIFGKIPKTRFQKDLNREGFNTFSDNTEAFIKEMSNRLKVDFSDFSSDVPEGLRETESTIKKNRQELGTKFHNYTALKEEYVKLKRGGGRKEDELSKRKEIKLLKKEIKGLDSALRKEEKTLANLHKELKASRKESFAKSEKSEWAEIGKLNTQIKNEQNLDRKEQLSFLRDTRQLFLQTKKTYYSKSYEEPDHVMDLQTSFAQLENLKGRSVALFCKSAEDRTGRELNKLEEGDAFQKANGHFAATSEEFKEIDEKYAKDVHMGSTSRENTRMNAPGARGLQISSKVNKPIENQAKIDKINAKMAKGAYKKLPKEASEFVRDMYRAEAA